MTSPRPALLPQITGPDDLRRLSEADLGALACELRAFLVDTVARTGGHLSAGLGTVELTIALHYVFHTPKDRLVWDVGHQTYPHKILTGRRERMHTLRQKDGLSGFPRREESEYDSFGVGHASTSVSAALGMAVAAAHAGSDQQVVAIIGDGALGGGMAFEALNHAGALGANLLVILNDNDMSISPNVGALSNYLTRILSGKAFARVREGGKTVLSTMPPMLEFAKRWEEHMKGMFVPSTLFEELGFNYFGPIDGHDLPTLVSTLRNLRQMKGPRFLHVVTRKGKGFEPAEGDPCVYHGVGPFDPATGKMEKKPAEAPVHPTYTQIFGEWLCDLAAVDPKVVGITPAMREGSGLVEFSQRYPDRYFDVGIAEEHAVTFAGGLACEGYKPVVAIYSTFLQRAYDQVIHDVCLQNLPVVFAVDRAGIVGPDGATHAGSFDLTFLRCLPNITLMAPADGAECRRMLTTAVQVGGPAAVRYPRGGGAGPVTEKALLPLPIGKAEVRVRGQGLAILAFGALVGPAEIVGRELGATVINMRFIKPLDTTLITELARSHERLVTVEENAIAGGAGSAVQEFLTAQGLPGLALQLGLPDRFLEHGERGELLAACGLDIAGLRRSVSALIPRRVAGVGETP